MLSGPFRPGELSAPAAARMNAMWRDLENFKRLTAAPPFSLTRQGGVPAVAFDDRPAILAEVVSDDGGTPPVHTCKRLTPSEASQTLNTVVDYSPDVVFDRVLAPDGSAVAAGTKVQLVPVADRNGWYWAFPPAGALAFDEINIASTSVQLTADNTPEDVMSLDIPAAGTYLITMTLFASGYQTTVSSGTLDYVLVYPIDFTTGTSLNAQPLAHCPPVAVANKVVGGTAVWTHVVTFDDAYTITVQAQRTVWGGGVWANHPTTGRGTYSYTRVA